jgi:hypothetical protein
MTQFLVDSQAQALSTESTAAGRKTIFGDLVSVTTTRHRSSATQGGKTADDAAYAVGSVRDSFLSSLEENDLDRAASIARHLVSCSNPLPTATCIALGLPARSSYGAAARAVLSMTVASSSN